MTYVSYSGGEARSSTKQGVGGPAWRGPRSGCPGHRGTRGASSHPRETLLSGTIAPQTLLLRRGRPVAVGTPAVPVRTVPLAALHTPHPRRLERTLSLLRRHAGRQSPSQNGGSAGSQVRPPHRRSAAASCPSICKGFRSLKFRSRRPEAQPS